MHATQLISIGLFTGAVILTLYAWNDRIRYSSRYSKATESFQNPPNPLSVPPLVLAPMVSENPTDQDAINAHKTLLIYTSQNVAKGLRFIKSIGKNFFVEPITLRTDIDPASLMNNYVSPLQIV